MGVRAAVRGRFLPGCTADGCAEHGSLLAAAAVCDVLAAGCSGVTVNERLGSYQTRQGATLQRSPNDEASWLKRLCELRPIVATPEDDDDDS